MTIERRDRKVVIECDVVNCPDEVEGDDWESLWRSVSASGWRAKKIGRDWVHGCPKHAREI